MSHFTQNGYPMPGSSSYSSLSDSQSSSFPSVRIPEFIRRKEAYRRFPSLFPIGETRNEHKAEPRKYRTFYWSDQELE